MVNVLLRKIMQVKEKLNKGGFVSLPVNKNETRNQVMGCGGRGESDRR